MGGVVQEKLLNERVASRIIGRQNFGVGFPLQHYV